MGTGGGGGFMILQGLLQFWITRMVEVQLSYEVIGRSKLNPSQLLPTDGFQVNPRTPQNQTITNIDI